MFRLCVPLDELLKRSRRICAAALLDHTVHFRGYNSFACAVFELHVLVGCSTEGDQLDLSVCRTNRQVINHVVNEFS